MFKKFNWKKLVALLLGTHAARLPLELPSCYAVRIGKVLEIREEIGYVMVQTNKDGAIKLPATFYNFTIQCTDTRGNQIIQVREEKNLANAIIEKDNEVLISFESGTAGSGKFETRVILA